jgi:hypothetical protein
MMKVVPEASNHVLIELSDGSRFDLMENLNGELQIRSDPFEKPMQIEINRRQHKVLKNSVIFLKEY